MEEIHIAIELSDLAFFTMGTFYMYGLAAGLAGGHSPERSFQLAYLSALVAFTCMMEKERNHLANA